MIVLPRESFAASPRPHTRFVILAVLILIAAAVSPVAAQSITATTGAVNGTVTDTTQAVIRGVAVTLSGPSLLTRQTATTDEAGSYRFSAVPPGEHS
jgi:hypothetical protein